MRKIIWIGSYPKSGNTWVRAFLGRYCVNASINKLFEITTTDTRQDWYNLASGRNFTAKNINEAIKLRPKVQRLIAESHSGSQFVKTHSKIGRIGPVDLIQPSVTAAAICIIRNPFDVAISFARHSNITIDEAIDRMCNPINMTTSPTKIVDVLGRWDDHVQSWMKAPGLAHHLMRYEDMVANPKTVFENLLSFLQLPVEQQKLRMTLKATSFNTLQKQEQSQGFREKPVEMKQFFVSGKSGGWVNALTVEQVERIYDEFKPTIEEFFPEIGSQAEVFLSDMTL